MRKKKKKKRKSKLNDSPINFWSDLLVASMVVCWIADIIYESIIATIVTISSVVVSVQTGSVCIDTSMWGSIGEHVAIPLSSAGALWMIKCAVQHAIYNHKGEEAPYDFPRIDGAELGDKENLNE